MGSRSGSITVPLCRNWNYPTSDPTFRLQIGSHAQVPDEYITLQEETLGVRRDSVLVGFALGGLLISSFPSIGLRVLQRRLGWLGMGFLGREIGLRVD